MSKSGTVRERIESLDTLMAYYVAGALPEPARVLVASHLEMNSVNRSLVADLDYLAGEALELTPPSPIADRDRRLASIFRSAPVNGGAFAPVSLPQSGSFPRALRDFVGFDVGDVPWRTVIPGLREYEVGDIDGCEVSLFWIRPGRAIPSHTHKGVELTLILEGAYVDSRGRFGRGDISVADDSVDHRPVAEKSGPCIALSVMDAPIKLTGSLTRLIGDFIG